MSQESAESRRILAGELALGLVHEMNQPIQLLAGHLERLREGAPPEWARSLVSMERAVQRISLLVLQLRGYSHPRSGPDARPVGGSGGEGTRFMWAAAGVRCWFLCGH